MKCPLASEGVTLGRWEKPHFWPELKGLIQDGAFLETEKFSMLSFQFPGLSIILLEYAKPFPNVLVLPATSLRKRNAPRRGGP